MQYLTSLGVNKQSPETNSTGVSFYQNRLFGLHCHLDTTPANSPENARTRILGDVSYRYRPDSDTEEDDNLIAFPIRDSVEDLRLSVTFDNVNECDSIRLFRGATSQSVERRRSSFLRKSFDLDCAFFTHAGLLNLEELCLINKGFKNDDFQILSSGTRKDGQPYQVLKVKSVGASKSQNLSLKGSKGMPKTRISDHQCTSTTEKNCKVHRSCKSSSCASSKSIKRKIIPINTKSTTSQSHHSYESFAGASSKSIKGKIITRNTKLTASPSSVLSPLASPCSPSTSSASHFHNAISTTSFQTPSHASCQSSQEKKLTCQYATDSSIRKIKSSGLQVPSRRIGFFDEEQPMLPFSLSPFSTKNCSKVRKVFSGELDGKKSGASCSKLETNGQIQKDKPKNRRNVERKSRKGDTGSLHMIDLEKKRDESDRCSLKKSQNKNMYSFEDKVIDRHLKAIDLDKDVTEVKGQWSCIKSGQFSLPSNGEHTTTPCSQTLLAEKMSARFDNVNMGHSIKLFGGADSHLQPESVEPRNLSLFRTSLDWDSTFFTSAGLLTPEDLCMINEGFKKAESIQPSTGSKKHVRSLKVAGWDQRSLDSDGSYLEYLKGDHFKDVNLDIHRSPVKKTNPRESQKLNCRKLTTQQLKRSIGPKDWFSCLPVDCKV